MRAMLIAMIMILAMSAGACSPQEESAPPAEQTPGGGSGGGPSQPEQPSQPERPENPPQNSSKMRITAANASFTVTLTNTTAAQSFAALLPMTVNMSEHNGNEKYYNLPRSLPTATTSESTIRNGDIMLFGSSTLVVFYKTFSTSYKYTPIGRIDNPLGLAAALGSSGVTVKFELQQE